MHCNQGAGDAVPFGRPHGGTEETDGFRHPGDPGPGVFRGPGIGPGRPADATGMRSTSVGRCTRTTTRTDFGRFFIQFYFFVDLPSRYWDGEKLARTVDLCYQTGARQVRNDEHCEPMRKANPGRRVQWDEPASPFNGADRKVFMVDIRLDNNAGQTDWYTDIYGSNWSAEPFAGSIKQHVGTTPIRAAASYRPSPIRSIEFSDGLGLHAPN